MRDRFADVVEEALAGDLEHWRRTPRGSIALVIVLDQLQGMCIATRTTPYLQGGPRKCTGRILGGGTLIRV